jgi:DNA-binding transcriptional LysR family regulator
MNEVHYFSQLARFDLNLFRVFATVYLEGNLTRAADRLSLSQSAISHALSRMRAQLDDPLFVREAQGVMPTPLAHRLWPTIRQGLELLGQAVLHGEKFEPARDIDKVTLAINDKVEPSLLPMLVSALQAQVPSLVVASVRVDRISLKPDLASGRLDAAIDVFQGAIEGLSSSLLLRDEWIVVSRSASSVTRKNYLSASHAIVSSRRTGRAAEDIELSRQGISRKIAARCQYYESACRLVAQSDMLLTMPRGLAESIDKYLGVHIHALPLSKTELRVHMFWHSERDNDPASMWLRSLLHEAIGKR